MDAKSCSECMLSHTPSWKRSGGQETCGVIAVATADELRQTKRQATPWKKFAAGKINHWPTTHYIGF